MPLVDQELQEFHEVLARMDEAESGLMFETAAHAKARKAEEAMRAYYRKQRWTVYPPQKKLTEHGPDAIAWKKERPEGPLEIRIIDNKSSSQRTVVCPTGLSRRSLWEHLKPVIEDLSKPPGPKDPTIPFAKEACELLKKTRMAAVKGEKLPSGVTLWVTNVCGTAESVNVARFPPGRIRLDPIRDKVDKSVCAPS
jgi:hypothetical protein